MSRKFLVNTVCILRNKSIHLHLITIYSMKNITFSSLLGPSFLLASVRLLISKKNNHITGKPKPWKCNLVAIHQCQRVLFCLVRATNLVKLCHINKHLLIYTNFTWSLEAFIMVNTKFNNVFVTSLNIIITWTNEKNN